MDNLRYFLLAALAFVGFLLWQSWQHDYGQTAPPPKPPAATQQQGQGTGASRASAAAAKKTGKESAQSSQAQSGLPSAPQSSAKKSSGSAGAATSPTRQSAQQGTLVHVDTDVLHVVISTLGGGIRDASLSKYSESSNNPNVPFRLLTADPSGLYVAQNGLLSPSGAEVPNHHSSYRVARTHYRLAKGSDTVTVPLHWRKDGISVTKVYTLQRGKYTIGVKYQIHNATGKPLTVRQYSQLERRHVAAHHGLTGMFHEHTFKGGAYYTGKYEKVSYGDLKGSPVKQSTHGGWVAMVQQYFVGAAIPPSGAEDFLYGKQIGDDRYVMGFVAPSHEVGPGQDTTLDSRLYVGPQLQNRLASIAKGLDLTVDYGMLTVIAKPLFWLLSKLHMLLGNWGWAIIGLTVLIKAAFYKLSEAQYRSMAKMRKFAPRIKALRERYGDDKQKLNQEMMQLYRQEKFNPLGGCLPLIVQLPVFLALYWVLLQSVELRHAPFMFWIQDLTSPDPYYVLPILFGISMFFQQKLSASAMTMDPTQQKIMMFMPIGLSIFFAFFPSGLVLYWLTNNVLSIAQQWFIMKRMEDGSDRHRRKKKA
ncbi:MAG TPA: membrane protein insertase YidC [Gammaproteobacteria bacterium]|nr:membrane protein insertase YidC [Gammaproteobacteria bacterium]